MSVIMTACLSLSLLFPSGAAVSATSKMKAYHGMNAIKATQVEKVSNKLLKEFKDKKIATFLVKFKEQVDAEKEAKKAMMSAQKKKMSSYQTELMKRSAVVSTLQAKALESQKEVSSYLEEQKKKGEVKKIHAFFIVNAMAVTATKAVMDKLATMPEVEKITANEVRKLQPVQSPKKKATSKESNTIEWNVQKVDAPKAWAKGIDGTGTVIASIDTGVEATHPAIASKYRGYDAGGKLHNEYNWFDATEGEDQPYDDIGHGTHTVGTMVGSEKNGKNKIGVAPGAKWIAVKAFTEEGGTDEALLAAGQWVIAPTDAAGKPHPEKAPDVVNNSWGGGPGMDDWYRPMVKAWRAAEIFPEFSAGNTDANNEGGRGSVANPANYPESFATGAVNDKNQVADFSLRGPSPYEGLLKPEVSAPGVNIRSSVPGGKYEDGWDGTSMAGPHVSAIAAMLRQVNHSLTVKEMEEIIKNTATPLTDKEYPKSPNNGYGAGLVNAYEAVNAVTKGLGKVTGVVTKDGNDTKAPVFKHEAVKTASEGITLPLTIDVQDDVSVVAVTLQYSDGKGGWKERPAELVNGSVRSGTYAAEIPNKEMTAPSLAYRFKIKDFGKHEVTSDPYHVTVTPSIKVGYETDFEKQPAGWRTFGVNNNWEWGVPKSGPKSAASGTHVYGTNLKGLYANSADMFLMMPSVKVEKGSTFLQFKHWFEFEKDMDGGAVIVSTDEKQWNYVKMYTGKSRKWVDGEVDLSDYAGMTVSVGFEVRTDEQNAFPGWYLDDVKLSSVALPKGKVATDAFTPKKPFAKLAKEKPTLQKATVEANSGIPMEANVSLLESGKSTVTNPATGEYTLYGSPGNYTLAIDAYGYTPMKQKVQIDAKKETSQSFKLKEKAKGTLSGKVTNAQTGKPVAKAVVYVLEDGAVTPVLTDQNGVYHLTAYEGNYTLRIGGAGYYSQEVSVTLGKQAVKDIQLKPFLSAPGKEIGYDDGSEENAVAFFDPNNYWAVKMSLPKGKTKAMVTGGMYKFSESFPMPGGTEMQAAVYDASGKDGAPGKRIAGPINATALRNGEWTKVDFGGQSVQVSGDFYIVSIQTKKDIESPGIAADLNSPSANRGFTYVNGVWEPFPSSEGNLMIRALVEYEVTAPMITKPTNASFTNLETYTVEGTTAPTIKVALMNDGKQVSQVTSDKKGKFKAPVKLHKGKNVLSTKAVFDRGSTEVSAPVVITLDRTPPKLTITSPSNGIKTNKETVTITGTASDDFMKSVTINGENVSLQSKGKFEHRLMLQSGKNQIRTTVVDRAGNATVKELTIYAQFKGLALTNMKPARNVTLKAGQTLKVECDTLTRSSASFLLRLPLSTVSNKQATMKMKETTAGHYVGYYKVPKNVKASDIAIEISVKDSFGNTTTKLAPGRLTIQ
ncbi:S8 family serine peptidase [Fictibacillus macauensis]|nr:S8 family serine peptidase [Fictibacillus macauensis]